jgi:hypothetical protein
MKKVEKKVDLMEESELRWPDGCERTRIKERQTKAAWKFPWAKYRDMAQTELLRMGATSVLVTRAKDERLDPGVAIWFSMAKQDFSWQQGLGIETPAPTLEQIDSAYREKARSCHPDRPDGGDSELFKRLTDWRTQAKAWVTQTHTHSHEYVMAIDQYDQARLNLCALRLAFFYIRRLEDVGAPAILTQTLGAFRAKLPMNAGDGAR